MRGGSRQRLGGASPDGGRALRQEPRQPLGVEGRRERGDGRGGVGRESAEVRAREQVEERLLGVATR
ncbi:hypothetical protein G7070_15380 [Propioniciclava coleopterorum]|uniref:Uncharacterized protein n=1 Tax=Propioniciclava coleopterorum TaxID=2714937 RepID=A0A6G7Y9S8_9ACTN|nr:hypothetical protein [Propioniciclava coleopterorum]QIK73391.1 hypothetical protein G7070_15380 [Propioniciclava coleopterorum]